MQSKIVKYIEAESRMVIARSGVGGNEEMLVKGYKVSVIQDDGIAEI